MASVLELIGSLLLCALAAVCLCCLQWQFSVRTWFNQPARKLRRRNGEQRHCQQQQLSQHWQRHRQQQQRHWQQRRQEAAAAAAASNERCRGVKEGRAWSMRKYMHHQQQQQQEWAWSQKKLLGIMCT
jgi:hypothetical protein